MKSNILYKFLFIYFNILGLTSNAQEFSIKGQVKFINSTQAIENATIFLVADSISTFTDRNGFFTISNLKKKAYQLSVSKNGYETNTYSINLNSDVELNIDLTKTSKILSTINIVSGRSIVQSDLITSVDMKIRPINSSQDLFRLVPGLFIAQHAGGGKAEQLFFRGFDSDHGTDFYISMDGMPVNMVSHAHGQGYADFHFVIPETIDKLKVYKGPYAAKFGDFSTSGSAEFTTMKNIDNSFIKLEVGNYDTYRLVTMLNLSNPNKPLFSKKGNENFYVAGEYAYSNSYFDIKQRFSRYNIFSKYSSTIGKKNIITISLSNFKAQWNGSGQIPQRAIDQGLISRYGSIDSTEGGNTKRLNINTTLSTILNNHSTLKNQIYYVNYGFKLYSNFTFFLQDTTNGDAIAQTDQRHIVGYTSSYENSSKIGKYNIQWSSGVGLRYDHAIISLEKVKYRNLIAITNKGILNQLNIFAYEDATIQLRKNISLNVSVRFDYFNFNYSSLIDKNPSVAKGKFRVSPKLNFSYTYNEHLQLFVKSGLGFHSNDARVLAKNKQANSLPIALGYEIGAEIKVSKSLFINSSLWGLSMQSELVYVGDEGTAETNNPTQRIGLDIGLRYQLSKNFFTDIDFNYNYGKLIGVEKGKNNIPLAPRITSVGGFTYKNKNGLNASIRYRYIDSRPANEDNSVKAKGYFLIDAVLSYHIKQFNLGLNIENLLNSKWNEAQFDTESRLQAEKTAVSELHFTPGTPIFIKGLITYQF